MAPKFGVGKRVIGCKGPNSGVHGVIINRLKVGNVNLLDIRWDNGGESRITTAFIDLEDVQVVNHGAVGNGDVGPRGQIVDEIVEDNVDNLSVDSESTGDSEGEDVGDLDGYNKYYCKYLYY